MEEYKECTSEDSDDSIFEDDYCIHKEFSHFKDNKKESLSKSDALEKASRFIFAEDLVSYISLKFHGYVYATKINKGSENTILSYPFNEVVRSAVQFIRCQIIETECSSFHVIKKLIKSSKLYYECFVESILDHYSEKGLTAGMFLYSCVYFAELASKCYTPDFEEILDFAVYAILDAFCMFKEGTDELNKFANAVAYKLKDYSFHPNCNDSMRTFLKASDVHSLDNTSKDEDLVKSFSVLEGDLEESRSTLELKLVNKSNKFEILSNLDCEINKIDQLTKYMRIDRNDVFCFMAKDCAEPKNEVNLTKSQNISPAVNIPNSVVFVQEFMTVVKSEASLFSEIYLMPKNQQKPDSPNEKDSENQEGNVNLMEFLDVSKIGIENSDIMPQQLSSQTFSKSKAEIPVHQETKRKCHNSNYKKVKCLKTVSKVKQDKSSSKNTQGKEKKLVGNLTQPKCKTLRKGSRVFDDTMPMPADLKEQEIEGLVIFYKREGQAHEKNLKVLKGESLLFAKDLVRYISNTFYGLSYPESNFEEYRYILGNEFNETVKEVAHFIHEATEAVNVTVFDLIKTEQINRADCYRKYVTKVLSDYTQGSLNSDAFLYYCLHFSEIASKLYAFDPEILDLAVCSILDAFCCLIDDWSEFHATIEYVLKCFKTRIYVYENQYCYVDQFEKECIDKIVGSLKEITSCRTHFSKRKLLPRKV